MSKWSRAERSHMKFAESLAAQSDCANRHGCVIYRKSMMVGNGINRDKTHPAAVCYYSNCIHAEFAAVITANKKHIPGSDVFVARVMRSKGEPLGMSRPCFMCMKMLRKARIRKVYYTNRDGNWIMERL